MMQKFRDQSNWSKGGSIGVLLYLFLLLLGGFLPDDSIFYFFAQLPIGVLESTSLLDMLPPGPGFFMYILFGFGFYYIVGVLFGWLYGKAKNRNKVI